MLPTKTFLYCGSYGNPPHLQPWKVWWISSLKRFGWEGRIKTLKDTEYKWQTPRREWWAEEGGKYSNVELVGLILNHTALWVLALGLSSEKHPTLESSLTPFLWCPPSRKKCVITCNFQNIQIMKLLLIWTHLLIPLLNSVAHTALGAWPLLYRYKRSLLLTLALVKASSPPKQQEVELL